MIYARSSRKIIKSQNLPIYGSRERAHGRAAATAAGTNTALCPPGKKNECINGGFAGHNGLMKNFCITISVFFIIIAAAAAVCLGKTESGGRDAAEYLRIHVRANSNSDDDQNVKYIVKDAVVRFITPLAAQCNGKSEAVALINANIGGIESVCRQTLEQNGFYYGANAEIRREEFPTRVYGDVTLESGDYDALIIELGEGSGDNWWCVLYPPLCFTSATQDVTYRSLIADIRADFFD